MALDLSKLAKLKQSLNTVQSNINSLKDIKPATNNEEIINKKITNEIEIGKNDILYNATQINPTLEQIRIDVNNLRELSFKVNFKHLNGRQLFINKVNTIKNNYRKIEGILTNKTMPTTIPHGVKILVANTIIPSQMDAWINKIQKDMEKNLTHPNLTVIKQHHIFLDMIVKVINGDAYFVGCKQQNEIVL